MQPGETLNLARWFLEERVREGLGDRVALRTDDGNRTYSEVHAGACRWAELLRQLDVRPEERVIVALPDGPEWVESFFGILRMGGVVVMVNPYLRAEQIGYFLEYTRARAAVVHEELAASFREALQVEANRAPEDGVLPVAGRHLRHLLVVGGDAGVERRVAHETADHPCFDAHPDDPAIWIFSGGTTGKPKAVVQPHRSFVNTTRLYAHGVLGIGPDDVTISVPKLFFGYATGSNLLFPMSVGASAVLFPERCTPEVLFGKIERHRPTVLVNVPTMINQMVGHEAADQHDLSCLRLATSAGEALPAELHERWNRAFGVELLDGLGTAEQWHVFLSNRPGGVKPGTLGRPVPGFDVRLCDDEGNDVPAGEAGRLRVAGDSRAIAYWQRHDRSLEAFEGRWYVSGDMLRRDEDGCYVYCGRADDMLKVSGKWMSPGEVENVLLGHPAVREAVVVGVEVDGLTVPRAFVVMAGGSAEGDPGELGEELAGHVRARLESYKCPREFRCVAELPRTHLGKVDRGALKAL